MFGYVQWNIAVRENLSGSFANLPPILKNNLVTQMLYVNFWQKMLERKI